jgi:hypothetical protein
LESEYALAVFCVSARAGLFANRADNGLPRSHWQSAPDRLKSHDFTVWAPLSFSPDGNVTTRGFESAFTVDVGV